MKSKSFDLKKSSNDSRKHNKSFDFSGYYKSIETSKLDEVSVYNESENKEVSDSRARGDTLKQQRSQKKKKNKSEQIDVSLVDLPIVGQKQLINGLQHTSTPYSTSKAEGKVPIVKSIIKKSSFTEDDTMDGSIDTSSSKSKKRNKSVSFMLDDNEEVAIKKTKSNDSVVQDKIDQAKKKSKLAKSDLKKIKKMKKQMRAEKENNDAYMATVHLKNDDTSSAKKTKTKSDALNPQLESIANSDCLSQVDKKKTKVKKVKKQKEAIDSEPTETESNNNEETQHKVKKLKKKKHQPKTVQTPDTTETEGEPASKSRKSEIKPEIVAEDLENLTIGDNPHTLTNLLDEMTVIDKDKKKKKKTKLSKQKNDTKSSTSVSNSETTDLEKIEEGKEKIKWKKRKWNKDKKADIEAKLASTVIVENLPLSILMDYKSLLSDHFAKCGFIQRIGVAELYSTSEPKDLFTTTIQFHNEAAATKALEENNTVFHGSHIRVSHPLPPTQTTVVVKSYGELSENAISTLFSSAGRVRNIKLMVKGRRAMATAFVEFDGPAAVTRAVKMAAEDVRIGGKKVHVSKFEVRNSRSRKPDRTKASGDSEHEGGSEDEDSNE